MFYSIFATLSALIGAYSQTSTLAHDFNHLSVIESTDLFMSDIDETDNYSYTSKLASTTFWSFSDMQDITKNQYGYHALRYYISSAPQNSTYLAYVDFYCDQIDATPDHLVTYYLPSIKITLSENFNFQLDFKWSFYNADFPSVPITYSRNIDFSTESSRVVYLQVERSELLSSTYANITYDLTLNGVAMSQEQFNAVSNARESGFDEGYTLGYNDGQDVGYQTGYTTGFNDAGANTGQPSVIFSGILAVALVPVNFFLSILNFEVFGINIGGFVTGLLTLAIIMIIWRVILGGKVKN